MDDFPLPALLRRFGSRCATKISFCFFRNPQASANEGEGGEHAPVSLLQSTEGIDRMYFNPSVSAPGGLIFHQN